MNKIPFFTVIAVLFFVACGAKSEEKPNVNPFTGAAPAAEPEYLKSIQKFRAGRAKGLAKGSSWFSVVGLTWLKVCVPA